MESDERPATPTIDAWLAADKRRQVLFDDEARAAVGWHKRRSAPHCVLLLPEEPGLPKYGLSGGDIATILAVMELHASARWGGLKLTARAPERWLDGPSTVHGADEQSA